MITITVTSDIRPNRHAMAVLENLESGYLELLNHRRAAAKPEAKPDLGHEKRSWRWGGKGGPGKS